MIQKNIFSPKKITLRNSLSIILVIFFIGLFFKNDVIYKNIYFVYDERCT